MEWKQQAKANVETYKREQIQENTEGAKEGQNGVRTDRLPDKKGHGGIKRERKQEHKNDRNNIKKEGNLRKTDFRKRRKGGSKNDYYNMNETGGAEKKGKRRARKVKQETH